MSKRYDALRQNRLAQQKSVLMLLMSRMVLGVRPLVATLFIVLAIPAIAHQPNYIASRTRIIDMEPTISKAYYGELNGQEAEYEIIAESSFDLYLNILSPYKAGAFRDFFVVIKDSKGVTIGTLNNPSVDWSVWYEEYAGDWYWQGPELKAKLPPGTYTISVQNPGRSGKYILAIGEDEAFPLGEMPHTLKELYLVKTIFFDDPWYSIYRGIVGRYLIYASLVVFTLTVVIVGIAVWAVRKSIRSKRRAA